MEIANTIGPCPCASELQIPWNNPMKEGMYMEHNPASTTSHGTSVRTVGGGRVVAGEAVVILSFVIGRKAKNRKRNVTASEKNPT